MIFGLWCQCFVTVSVENKYVLLNNSGRNLLSFHYNKLIIVSVCFLYYIAVYISCHLSKKIQVIPLSNLQYIDKECGKILFYFDFDYFFLFSLCFSVRIAWYQIFILKSVFCSNMNEFELRQFQVMKSWILEKGFESVTLSKH